MVVATDLMRRGYKVALPYGEDWDFDLILSRAGKLERVQVKHTRSDGKVIVVRCRSISLTSGRIRAVKQYTAETIDWLAVYDVTSDSCYYVPACELGTGRSSIHLRLVPPANNMRHGIRYASDYREPSSVRVRHETSPLPSIRYEGP